MCKHKFEVGLLHAPKTCYLQSIYKEHYYTLGKIELAYDDDGFCLFHSSQIEWKLENKFEMHLSRILDLMLNVSEYKEVDLRGIQVASEKDKGIEWKGFTTSKSLNLCGAYFHSSLSIEDCHFGGALYLDKFEFIYK